MASALLCCSKEAGTMTEAAPLDKETRGGGRIPTSGLLTFLFSLEFMKTA